MQSNPSFGQSICRCSTDYHISTNYVLNANLNQTLNLTLTPTPTLTINPSLVSSCLSTDSLTIYSWTIQIKWGHILVQASITKIFLYTLVQGTVPRCQDQASWLQQRHSMPSWIKIPVALVSRPHIGLGIYHTNVHIHTSLDLVDLFSQIYSKIYFPET